MSINPIRPWRNIYRRQSRKIMVGAVESAATRRSRCKP